jgi:hypothetical protein
MPIGGRRDARIGSPQRRLLQPRMSTPLHAWPFFFHRRVMRVATDIRRIFGTVEQLSYCPKKKKCVCLFCNLLFVFSETFVTFREMSIIPTLDLQPRTLKLLSRMGIRSSGSHVLTEPQSAKNSMNTLHFFNSIHQQIGCAAQTRVPMLTLTRTSKEYCITLCDSD